MKMKKLAVILLAGVLAVSAVACGSKPADGGDNGSNDDVKVAVLIKATDSTFWQKVGEGAEKYGKDNEGVKVEVQGPASEAAIEQSLSLLENVILSEPDAIVLGSNAAEGANAALADAKAAGIPVITVDTQLPSEDVTAHLATDNYKGGELAAEAMVKSLQDQGKELKGKVGIISAVAGVQTCIDRDEGFASKMKEIAPDIEILEPIYIDNEISKAIEGAENLMTSYGDDLIGIYGDANHPGDGLAKAIEQAGAEDKVTVVSFDDDPEEIEGLKNGSIKALIIQDQFNMGYSGVEYAVKASKGEKVEALVDTGVKVTWPEDLQ